jgi:hypothetical protein
MSIKETERVKAYGANSTVGIIRKVNEDRVTVLHNMIPSESVAAAWPT